MSEEKTPDTKASSEENLNVPPSLVEGDAFSGVAKAMYDDPESETTLYRVPFLNAAFAISSLVLLVLTVAAIYQDFDREWKHYQYEWKDYQAEQYSQELQAEEQRIQDELAALQEKLDEAEASISRNALKLATTKADELVNEENMADTAVKFLKSTIQAEKFVLEETKRRIIAEEGGETPRAQARMAKVDQAFDEKYIYPLRELEKELEQAKIAAAEARAEVDRLTKEKSETITEIAALTRQRGLLKTNLDGVRASAENTIRNLPLLDFFNPSAKIEKVVLTDLTENLNFMDVGRVDRCKSCHVNIDDVDPEVAAIEMEAPHGGRVFRSHPRLDLYVGSTSPHPMAEFGCTICHYGDGHSLTFHTSAHTPSTDEQKNEWEEKYHWHKMHHQDYPMLAGKYVSATCAKCHDEQSRIPGADLYNEGREIVERSGCHGCHKMAGFEDYRKAGPDLSYISQKLDTDSRREFLYKWIRNPTHFRPTTLMPRFFDLANSTGSIEVTPMHEERDENGELLPRIHDFDRRNAIESLAIAAYIDQTSKARDDLRPASKLQGDPEAGKVAFRESGCLGCHSVIREGWTENDRAPDLSAIGSKVSARWLADWIVNPSKHFPETRMPRLRIEQDENGEQKLADVVAYLMSLRDESFEERAVPEMDEENRRILKDIAFDYYSRQLIRSEAVQKIESYYEPEGLNGHSDKALTLRKGDASLLSYVGSNLIRRYGCFGCHSGIEGFEAASPIGTELTKHGVKGVDRLDFGQWGHQPNGEEAIPHERSAWFENKLENTRIFDMFPVRRVDGQGNVVYEPGKKRMKKTPEELLKMPLFHFHDDPHKVDAVVTFLLSRLPDPIPEAKRYAVEGDRKLLEDGRRLVRDYNCMGCHRIGADRRDIVIPKRSGDPAKDFPRYSVEDSDDAVTTLNHLESETWLADDHEFGGFRIPANTLLSTRFVRPKVGTDPAEDEEEEYSVVEIAEQYWDSINAPDYNRVLRVHGYDEGRVRNYFGKNPEDRPKAAPLLRLQGDRTHGDWLFEFFLNVKPLRSWLALRMPSFPMDAEESSAIVGMFKVLANTPYPHEQFEEFEYTEENRELAHNGYELFSVQQPGDADKSPLPLRHGCANCHPRGSEPPVQQDKNVWGPDLGMARARLRPEWIRSWLYSPQYFMPGTGMPSFFFSFDPYEDPEQVPEKISNWVDAHMPARSKFGVSIVQQDWDRQIESLIEYLMHMPAVDAEKSVQN